MQCAAIMLRSNFALRHNGVIVHHGNFILMHN
jgi:hypothetical protein